MEKSTKHTEAFNAYCEKVNREPTFAEAENFVLRLSRETSDKVIARIVAKTGRTYTTNKDIYRYCKANGIEEDHNPYDNYEQKEFEFKPKVIDYISMKSMDDVEINGRKGFVVANEKKDKIIIIEFEDTEEMETINY